MSGMQHVYADGPDSHGTITVDCPWCQQQHHFSWNQRTEIDHRIYRDAGCLKSAGGTLIIEFGSTPIYARPPEPIVPTVQPPTVRRGRAGGGRPHHRIKRAS
jgi:hypothetical protein